MSSRPEHSSEPGPQGYPVGFWCWVRIFRFAKFWDDTGFGLVRIGGDVIGGRRFVGWTGRTSIECGPFGWTFGLPAPVPVTGPVTGGLPSPFGGVSCRQRRSSTPLRWAQGSATTGGFGSGSGLTGPTHTFPTRTIPPRQGSSNRHAPSCITVPGGQTGGVTMTTTGGRTSIGLSGICSGGGLLTGNGRGPTTGPGSGAGQF